MSSIDVDIAKFNIFATVFVVLPIVEPDLVGHRKYESEMNILQVLHICEAASVIVLVEINKGVTISGIG